MISRSELTMGKEMDLGHCHCESGLKNQVSKATCSWSDTVLVLYSNVKEKKKTLQIVSVCLNCYYYMYMYIYVNQWRWGCREMSLFILEKILTKSRVTMKWGERRWMLQVHVLCPNRFWEPYIYMLCCQFRSQLLNLQWISRSQLSAVML